MQSLSNQTGKHEKRLSEWNRESVKLGRLAHQLERQVKTMGLTCKVEHLKDDIEPNRYYWLVTLMETTGGATYLLLPSDAGA